MASGWESNRSAYDATGAEFGGATLNLYKTSYIATTSAITDGYLGDNSGPALAVIKARMASICEWVAINGYTIYILTHSASECTAAQLSAILDVIGEYTEITVTDSDTAVSTLKSLPYAYDQETHISSRTFTDQSDYHLQPTSPCRNVGAAIAGITTDLDGNQYPSPNGASIGPYEDYPLPTEGMGSWSHFDGSVNPLALSDTSPANLLEVKVETNE